MGRIFFARRTRWCLAAVVVGATMTLAGCGRKGPLEPPLGAAPVATPGAAQAAQTRVLQGTDTPGLIQSPNVVYEESAIAKLNSASRAPPPRPINAPPNGSPNTFFLDPLVK